VDKAFKTRQMCVLAGNRVITQSILRSSIVDMQQSK